MSSNGPLRAAGSDLPLEPRFCDVNYNRHRMIMGLFLLVLRGPGGSCVETLRRSQSWTASGGHRKLPRMGLMDHFS